MFKPLGGPSDSSRLYSGVRYACSDCMKIQRSRLPPCCLSLHSTQEGMWGYSGARHCLFHYSCITPLCLQEWNDGSVPWQTHQKIFFFYSPPPPSLVEHVMCQHNTKRCMFVLCCESRGAGRSATSTNLQADSFSNKSIWTVTIEFTTYHISVTVNELSLKVFIGHH